MLRIIMIAVWTTAVTLSTVEVILTALERSRKGSKE